MALGDPGAMNHYKVRYTSVAFATKVINIVTNIFLPNFKPAYKLINIILLTIAAGHY